MGTPASGRRGFVNRSVDESTGLWTMESVQLQSVPGLGMNITAMAVATRNGGNPMTSPMMRGNRGSGGGNKGGGRGRPANAPSTTGKPSGGGRGNNSPKK